MSTQAAGPTTGDEDGGHSDSHEQHGHSNAGFKALLIGCIGVVYGDIGTSPLYAFREAAKRIAEDGLSNDEILGIISLIMWSLTIIVTIKYVLFLLRADNKGEGGILSLMALTQRAAGKTGKSSRTGLVFFAGIVGAALFYGEAAITPAISVMSAIEGTKLITPTFGPYVVVISMVIIFGLFTMQKHGTEAVSKLFGPVMLVWFTMLGVIGLYWIIKHPLVLTAVNPYYAVHFLTSHGMISFVVLGSVFLAVTGAEALYTDLGHFGREPIQKAWLYFVFPSLMLNYMGQGALLIVTPAAIENPFFLMFPQWALIPMVGFATIATVIASQAVITGAYSIARQAIQLGFLPRMEIRHTSEKQEGQIYMPKVNSFLLFSVLFLCIVFRSSGAIAAAYGIAITGTMVVSSIIAFFYLIRVRKKTVGFAAMVILPFIFIEIAFFSSSLLKIFDGGIVPLLFGIYFVLLIITWVKGTEYLVSKSQAQAIALVDLAEMLERDPPHIVDGTAIFLTSDPEHAPETMMQNLKHNQVIHRQNIILTISIAQIPRVPLDHRVTIQPVNDFMTRIVINFGFMETPNVPAALYRARSLGCDLDVEHASFFLGHRKIIPDGRFGLPGWQDDIYVAMTKNAVDATDYFRIPPSQVVEIGTRQVI